MAITHVGSLLASSGVATNSTTISTVASGIQVEELDWIFVWVASNNTSSGADGDNNEVSGVTDTAGNTWRKIGEYTNTEGASGAGITVSLWGTQASRVIASGDLTITATYVIARPNKAIRANIFRSSTLSDFIVFNNAVTPDATDASNNFGSVSQPGVVPDSQVIYFRALGKQTNSATDLTPTAGWTTTGNQRSSTAAAARCAYGEFIIQDSTGQTSDPTLAVSGNTAGVFVAIAEGTDTDGETRLTQQHAIVVHAEADTPVRLTQLHVMVIHSKPRKMSGWIGHWI
jgi:hypothetical protein